jgi:hypothetical protein
LPKKADLQRIYSQFNPQIDAIASHPGMSYRKAARIIAWFYGGTDEGWRVFLASKKRKKTPPEVIDLLGQIAKSKPSGAKL